MYVLIWSCDNSDKRFILKSKRYFLGRPDHQDMEKLGSEVSGLDVLIFNPDNYSEKEFTGSRSLAVSRRHALIYWRSVEGRSELVIKDHGPNGTGSKNGTFINNKMLPKGGETILREGDTIRLSSLGPLFIVGIQKENKTMISISAGVPIEVPVQIAQKLVAKDAVADHFSLGNRSFVVVNDVGVVELGKDLVIDIKRVTRYNRIIMTISSLREELTRVKDSIKDGRDEDAKIALQTLEKMIEMEIYRSVFQEIGAQKVINVLYNDVIKPVNHGAPIEDVVNTIEVCIGMLKNLERFVLGVGFYM